MHHEVIVSCLTELTSMQATSQDVELSTSDPSSSIDPSTSILPQEMAPVTRKKVIIEEPSTSTGIKTRPIQTYQAREGAEVSLNVHIT